MARLALQRLRPSDSTPGNNPLGRATRSSETYVASHAGLKYSLLFLRLVLDCPALGKNATE